MKYITNKHDFIKIFPMKDNVKKIRRQVTEWRKYLQKTTDEGRYPK